MAAGVPSAIFGVFIWYFKRYIEKRDKVREAEARKREEKREAEIEEREKNTEPLQKRCSVYRMQNVTVT